ncbi:MAG: PilZ domain-containing protein, partial [Thermoanaerobaculia bacterium]
MRQERRRHPRLEIPLEAEVLLLGDGEAIPATMVDLSAGGAALLTLAQIPVGTEIETLRFGLPAGDDKEEPQPIAVAGRVARSEQLEGVGGEAQFQIGVQFVDITRELYDRIQQFVARQLREGQKERVPIERPIAIRFDRFDDFVDEVSVNLSTTGMFIRTRDPRQPGSVFNFQFQLGEDFSLIEGRAEVVWQRQHGEGADKPPGMGVKFLDLDVSSQQLIDRLTAQKQEAEADDEGDSQPAAEELAPDELHPQEVAIAEDTEEATLDLAPVEEPPQVASVDEASFVDAEEVDALRQAANQLREELAETRRDHEQELRELRASLEDRQAATSSELTERLDDAEAAHNDLEAAHEALQSELGGVRGEAEELRAQLDDRTPEAEVQRISTEREALKATNERLLADLDRTASEADELRRQLADRTAEREIERLAAERLEIQTFYDDLQIAYDGLRADLGHAHGEAEDLQAQLDSGLSEEEAKRLGNERDSLEATNERLRAELDQANTEADEIRGQLAERERAEADLQADLEVERGEIDRLQRSSEATILQLQTDHSATLERTAAELRQEAATRLEQLTVEHEERRRQEAEAAREERERLQADVEQERRDLQERAEAADREAAA